MANKLLNRNFGLRTLSALLLVVLVVGSILASPYAMMVLMAFLCLGTMLEFYRIARLTGAEPVDTYPTIVGVLTVLMAFFYRAGKIPGNFFLILLPAIFVLFIVELYRRKQTPFANIAWSLLGIIYIAVPFSILAYLPMQPAPAGYLVYRPMMLLAVILMVWANDVGAYLFGVTLGRHRLMERISPKKSWEGAIGGVLCAIGAGILLARWSHAPVPFWAGAGAVTAVGAIFGDLVESMLKRTVDLKDSGNVIPGHGGLLDRFDALILAAPFSFVYFIIFAP